MIPGNNNQMPERVNDTSMISLYDKGGYTMADLRTYVAGVEFKNPVIAAGSTVTLTLHNMRKCIEAGVGGIETKSISENKISQRWQYPANAFLDRMGHPYALTTWESEFPTIDESIEMLRQIMPLCKENNVRMLVNLAIEDVMDLTDLGGPKPVVTMKQWENAIREYEKLGVDIIQLVGPCPIIITDQAPMNSEWFMRWYDEHIPAIIEEVKAMTKLPVAVKQLFEFYPDIVRYANLIGNTSLDIMHNGFCAQQLYIDIDEGKVITPGALTYHHGASNWGVGLVANNNNGKPIISPCGIHTWSDVIERMMAGASACLISTAIMHDGYKWITDAVNNIDKWMDEKGYKNCSEFIGKALPTMPKLQDDYATGGIPEEFSRIMNESEVPKETTYIEVDQDKCIGCGKCQVCLFEAVTIEDKKAKIDPIICERCGCCWSLCPTKAINITHNYQGSEDYIKACQEVSVFIPHEDDGSEAYNSTCRQKAFFVK